MDLAMGLKYFLLQSRDRSMYAQTSQHLFVQPVVEYSKYLYLCLLKRRWMS